VVALAVEADKVCRQEPPDFVFEKIGSKALENQKPTFWPAARA
jgi:hypothetical protein